MACLLKWEPGATLPMHKHPELEQFFVLEGSLYDHGRVCSAGEYVWRHQGSVHETRSDESGILLAIYRKPNVFQNTAGLFSSPRPRAMSRSKHWGATAVIRYYV